jgi:hypothetical protein
MGKKRKWGKGNDRESEMWKAQGGRRKAEGARKKKKKKKEWYTICRIIFFFAWEYQFSGSSGSNPYRFAYDSKKCLLFRMLRASAGVIFFSAVLKGEEGDGGGEEEENKKKNKRKGGGRDCRTLTEFPRFKKHLTEKIFNSVCITSVSLQNELSSLGF